MGVVEDTRDQNQYDILASLAQELPKFLKGQPEILPDGDGLSNARLRRRTTEAAPNRR
jgi:hypothetical protein